MGRAGDDTRRKVPSLVAIVDDIPAHAQLGATLAEFDFQIRLPIGQGERDRARRTEALLD